ncbi:MAG TPA: AI-2E family transporter [Ignavibacteriaceae bacterium]|nr:AI-2E family transporter [Ignavibacteriaceae bacterium]
MLQKTYNNSSVKFFIGIIGIIAITLTLKELSHIFIPFVIAYFLFFVFSPLNNFLSRNRLPEAAIILIDILITGFIIWGIFKLIIDSFIHFTEGLPIYLNKLDRIISESAVSFGISDPNFTNFSIQSFLRSIDLSKIAGGLFESTFSFLGSVFFVLFFFIFIVPGHKIIYEAIKIRYLKSNNNYVSSESLNSPNLDESKICLSDKSNKDNIIKEEKLASAFNLITEQIQKYIIAKIGLNLACGVAVTILLSLLGVDFPIVWGLFTFLFNFIPTIGSAASLVLPTLMALVQFESVSFMLLVAAAMGALQTLFFNLFEPAIIGRKLNLNPLLILISLLIWGYIWGIVGMLLSVPLTAIIKIILNNSDSPNMKFISDLMSNE